jgi:type I restriction enzyme S subunit
MALCDRLEQEVGAGETAHAKLVETLLGTLTQSTDAAELAANWQRLAEHFDTLFTTEASLDALKRTILQLAVMGKLVPQDPNDEPANELLLRIAQERTRLETEGVCKKSKPMPPVGDDDGPFELPVGWIWERIGNYVLQTDYGLSEKTFAVADGIPVLKMGDIQGGNVILGGQKAVPPMTEGLPYLLLEPGDLLYNSTNSSELVGKTGIFRGPAQQFSFASYLIRIRCANWLVSPTFLNFVMNSPLFRETEIVPHLKQQCGQANVNGTILRNMRVPVPPAAEQHRIVAKVDELMAFCDRLKADLVESRNRQQRLATTLIETALEAA